MSDLDMRLDAILYELWKDAKDGKGVGISVDTKAQPRIKALFAAGAKEKSKVSA